MKMKTNIKLSMVMLILLSTSALGINLHSNLPGKSNPHDSYFGGRLNKTADLAYGGLRLKSTQIKESSNILVGGGGARVYLNKYLIGGEGYGGIVGDYKTIYGGMMLGGLFNPEKKINYTLKSRFGGGLVVSRSENSFYLNIEPQFDINLNIRSNVKGFLGIGLPYSFNFDTDDLNNNDLNHASFTVGLKFAEY
ncbi:hypothetical protein DID80_02435 [Candidatus Marinamargulisbacteria bacterium SCGC AAA071-K20]|nr:hypothetical protein DID80_02435 [Candidatus Marinamargulisbacteria bacterium SCGC AAA071-K20]